MREPISDDSLQPDVERDPSLVSLTEYLTNEGLPPVNAEFVFYLGGHGSHADLALIRDWAASDDLDILIVEGPGWSPLQYALVNTISQSGAVGNIVYLVAKVFLKGLDALSSSEGSNHNTQAMLDIIRAAKVPVTLIDLPSQSNTFFDLMGVIKQRHNFPETARRKKLDFDSAVHMYAQLLQTSATLQEKREQHMVRSLNVALVELLRKNPKLLEQLQADPTKKLRIGLFLGALHTGVSIALSQRGETVTRQFENKPFVFDHTTEVERAYRFGKEPSQELLAKALVSTILLQYIKIPDTHSSAEVLQIVRQAVEKLNPRSFYEMYTKLTDPEFQTWLEKAVEDQIPQEWFIKKDRRKS